MRFFISVPQTSHRIKIRPLKMIISQVLAFCRHMASASLWAQLEQDPFETGFSSFMNGLPDFAGSFTAESSFSPRASPPPPSVPETALTSTRDTPHGPCCTRTANPVPW